MSLLSNLGINLFSYRCSPTINVADPADKTRHDRMVTLVTQMLDLNKRLLRTPASNRKRRCCPGNRGDGCGD